MIHSTLAEAYLAKGDVLRVARGFEEALAINISIYGERHPDVAEDFVSLGELSLRKRERAAALRFFGKSIAANTRQAVTAASDLDPPIDAALSDEHLLRALKGAARAGRWGRPGGTSRRLLAATATETFDEAIRTELELLRLTAGARHLEEAYRCAERSKAGVLREALNEAEARSFARIPGALLEEERRLRQELAAADHRLEEAFEGGADEGRLRGLRDERFSLSRQYEALQARFEKEFPEYYGLTRGFLFAGAKILLVSL